MIHVFIGTKAQYIKTAPVMREMDRRQLPYRLIDSGQHGEFASQLRAGLGVREPDVHVGGSKDITTIAGALRWSAALSVKALNKRRLADEVFGGDRDGICVIHGDTPTTWLSGMLAHRCGLSVAHVESGLRSESLLHPFPEELIRIAVMRRAEILFAPNDAAVANLARMRTRGAIIPTGSNTSIEAVAYALGDTKIDANGPAILTTHRVENLKSRATMERFVALLESVAAERPAVFVMHPPTEAALNSFGLMQRVEQSGAEVTHLADYQDFLALIASAPFVVSDGGSIQEECALIGVPTLVWRRRTERSDGIGENVVLSAFDATVIETFLAIFEDLRRPPVALTATPSAQIVDVLEGWS